jgi:peptidoglycan-associated lipoprotein
MKASRVRRITAGLLLAALVLSVGCAKKKAPEPAQPPPAPTTQTPVPTPAPAPDTTTPPPPAPAMVSEADFQPVFFDLDQSTLNETGRSALDADAKVMRDHPTAHVVIEGHCDERGTVEYNQALGERRAAAARDYLVAAGITVDRLEMISYGKERPFSDGHDETAWAQNRRAHFRVRP